MEQKAETNKANCNGGNKNTARIRKWQRAEESTLIEFLKNNNTHFEKPTAKVFYGQFVKESQNADLDWKIVRSKVRNMQMCYNKAKQWLQSKEADDLNDEASVRDQVMKICYFYDDFEELFGCNSTDEELLNFKGFLDSESIKEEVYTGDNNTHCSAETEMEDKHIFESTTHPDTSSSKSRKRAFDFEVNLKEEELRLQREKLEFEKKKLKHEMDMKQKEIDSQERLKILELEMKERIAMNEIKMKERVAMKALEKQWD